MAGNDAKKTLEVSRLPGVPSQAAGKTGLTGLALFRA
jgi:hypothetical protein